MATFGSTSTPSTACTCERRSAAATTRGDWGSNKQGGCTERGEDRGRRERPQGRPSFAHPLPQGGEPCADSLPFAPPPPAVLRLGISGSGFPIVVDGDGRRKELSFREGARSRVVDLKVALPEGVEGPETGLLIPEGQKWSEGCGSITPTSSRTDERERGASRPPLCERHPSVPRPPFRMGSCSDSARFRPARELRAFSGRPNLPARTPAREPFDGISAGRTGGRGRECSDVRGDEGSGRIPCRGSRM